MDVEPDGFEGIEKFAPELIPEGAVPTHGIIAVEYVTAEGVTHHTYQLLGEARVVEALGLLSIAGLQLWDATEDEDEGGMDGEEDGI